MVFTSMIWARRKMMMNPDTWGKYFKPCVAKIVRAIQSGCQKGVKKRIETVGKGGGLLIAPAHTVERPTPPENVITFNRAIDDFGTY